MGTLKFKTNIKCGGCISTVTPHLNGMTAVSKWDVDTNNPDKILTIESDLELDEELIKETLKKAGFQAERV